MKSKYIRAICLGAAGLLVISTAAINNHKQSEDVTAKAVATASVIEESAETVDAGVTAGIASVTAQALASDEDVATVSDTDTELTAAAQEEVTSVYGYTNLGIAVVDSGNLNVRETPGTDAALVGKMPNHAACEVLGVDGEWTQIQSGEVTGYVKTEYLVTGNEAAALAEQVKETVAKVTTTTLYVREEPNTDCSIVTSMPMGEELEVVEQLDGWVKVSIDSDEGYVSADYIEINTELPTAMTMTEVRYGQGVSDVRVDLVSYACQFVGNPYVWGGTSLTDGADCSGFVQQIYKQYGYSLPRVAEDQSQYGTKIPVEDAQPGDLIFYAKEGYVYHVVMYAGDGRTIEAASTKLGIIEGKVNTKNAVWATRILKDDYSLTGGGIEKANATEDMYGQKLENFQITYYCPCEICCDKASKVTASGTPVAEGKTIATDPNVIPYGTKVIIGGHVFTAEDTGRKVQGNQISIYVNNHAEVSASDTENTDVYLAK